MLARKKSAPLGFVNRKVHFYYGICVWNFEEHKGSAISVSCIKSVFFGILGSKPSYYFEDASPASFSVSTIEI